MNTGYPPHIYLAASTSFLPLSSVDTYMLSLSLSLSLSPSLSLSLSLSLSQCVLGVLLVFAEGWYRIAGVLR
jgi:hypothetical protein